MLGCSESLEGSLYLRGDRIISMATDSLMSEEQKRDSMCQLCIYVMLIASPPAVPRGLGLAANTLFSNGPMQKSCYVDQHFHTEGLNVQFLPYKVSSGLNHTVRVLVNRFHWTRDGEGGLGLGILGHGALSVTCHFAEGKGSVMHLDLDGSLTSEGGQAGYCRARRLVLISPLLQAFS